MSRYPNTVVENGRLMCAQRHARVRVEILDTDENWIEVVCETCAQVLYYNGA